MAGVSFHNILSIQTRVSRPTCPPLCRLTHQVSIVFGNPRGYGIARLQSQVQKSCCKAICRELKGVCTKMYVPL
jgi:hypothetical protein